MKKFKKSQKIENESIYYGLNSTMMIFDKRPQDIKKIYLLKNLTPKVSKLLSYCSRNRIAYKYVDEAALESKTSSVHNEGICIIARSKQPLTQGTFLKKISQIRNDKSVVILLDDVKNPHNIGAIVRSMAHFGAKYILMSQDQLPTLSGANYRIAEGGYEFVDVVAFDNIDKLAFELKKQDFKIVGTSSHTNRSLYNYSFSNRTAIVVGNEVRGMSKKYLSICDEKIVIPGAGTVESLNVSVSVGLCLGEFYRQH